MRGPNLRVVDRLADDATDASITVEVNSAGKTYSVELKHRACNRFDAGLLQEALYRAITDRIEAVRRQEYERGYQAGRQHGTRATGFACTLALYDSP